MSLRPTAALCAKRRRSWLKQYQHRLMQKAYQNFASLGPELEITFDQSKDWWLSRMDQMQGEAQGGKFYTADADQYDADYQAARTQRTSQYPIVTPLEAYEMGYQVAPGELPFLNYRKWSYYDADKKAHKLMVAPFWWKRCPGDDGLTQNGSAYFTGAGSNERLEPTNDHLHKGVTAGERFEPATPEEAAEIEAEEKYERDMRNSMMQSVADLNIVEVPPYFVVGQKTWMSITPWYKAKLAKGTITEQEHGAGSWDMLVAWADSDPKPAAAAQPQSS